MQDFCDNASVRGVTNVSERKNRQGVHEAYRPRILLADGHSDMRQYLTQLLSEHYEIDAAADASTALALARERAPDLVVADVMMRAPGDLDILREFRRDAWRKVPIILYSTACDEDSPLNASEAGDDDVITPFSERQLLALVRAHLRVVQMRERIDPVPSLERRTLSDLEDNDDPRRLGQGAQRRGHQ